ncbi:MAG: hypothetical protein M3281_09825 [Chloroflexota bacterium]|nr:hypothetical protein [Chloroflexota bacterium]
MSYSKTEQREANVPQHDKPQSPVRTYDRWQLFFLERMQRMTEVSVQARHSGASDADLQALKWAIFSTLLDCDRLGVGDVAREFLAAVPGPDRL